MRKPNIIIGKKQIILAGLTLVLGIAVYMNYVFSEVGEEIAVITVKDYGEIKIKLFARIY